VEPATSLEVRLSPELERANNVQAFLQAALFGLLDVLLVTENYPLRNVRITFSHCEVDPVSSSQIAFRYAGEMLEGR